MISLTCKACRPVKLSDQLLQSCNESSLMTHALNAIKSVFGHINALQEILLTV